jgi:hypothetical protein
LEEAIGSAVWHKKSIFALRLEHFQVSGNLGGYLKTAGATWIEGASRFELGLLDLTKAVELRLRPPTQPRRKSYENDAAFAPPPPPEIPSSVQKPPEPREAPQKTPPSEQEDEPPSMLATQPVLSQLQSRPSRLIDLPRLRGFFSYSRSDDQYSANALSTLRDRIANELHQRHGRKIELWQDTHEMRTGVQWHAEIRKTIASSVFFIPIVTPLSINSPICGVEFKAFREQEKTLDRDDLIFPIIYIDVWQLHDEKFWKDDERLKLIAERHYEDFTKLRYLSLDDTRVKEFIGAFCDNIIRALRKQTEEQDA